VQCQQGSQGESRVFHGSGGALSTMGASIEIAGFRNLLTH
jgi:hypothetical protein